KPHAPNLGQGRHDYVWANALTVAHFVGNQRPATLLSSARAGRNPRESFGVAKQHDSEDILSGDNPLTLWHFADPSEAVDAALALYGSNAALAAASAAFTARYAGRQDDFRFWFAVFLQLRCCERKGAAASDEEPIVSPLRTSND
ncbi:hypothetical protein, partial [Mesorhizobium sp.]